MGKAITEIQKNQEKPNNTYGDITFHEPEGMIWNNTHV